MFGPLSYGSNNNMTGNTFVLSDNLLQRHVTGSRTNVSLVFPYQVAQLFPQCYSVFCLISYVMFFQSPACSGKERQQQKSPYDIRKLRRGYGQHKLRNGNRNSPYISLHNEKLPSIENCPVETFILRLTFVFIRVRGSSSARSGGVVMIEV